MSDVLKIETDGHVRLLTLNRPEVRNAINPELGEALAEAILDAEYEDNIFLIAITGAGDKAFCSGADLKTARDLADSGAVNRGPLHSTRVTSGEIMMDCRKPIMAIINGPAVAGGFEVALSCDLRVAADTAFFSMPEAKRGRGAHYASVVLPQIVPPAIAMEWLFTGRRIPVEEAERWGLINRIAPAGKLMETAMELAADVVSSAPLSLQRLKLTYRKAWGIPLHAGIRLDVGPDPYTSEDQKEGARAFLEKRDPVWQGR